MASEGPAGRPRAQPARCRPAIRRSPFPPIGEYGFLSDCESTALVAPSGNVEWLCLPRHRLAERLRRDPRSRRRRLPLRPVRHPRAGRAPLPAGHHGARDELGLADRLGDRARRPAHRPVAAHRGRGRTTHRRPPTDYDAEPRPAAHGALRERRDAADARLRAGLRLRPPSRHVGATPRTPTSQGVCRSDASDVELVLTQRHQHRLRGPARVGRTMIKEGESRFCRARLAWRRGAPTADDAYRRLVWTAHHWQHWLARGTFPDHPVALAPRTLGADAQGPDVRAERGDRGRADHLAARDAGRRAQLGLPLLLDPRLDLRAVGPVHARLRVGGERLPLLHRRRRRARSTSSRSCTASTASAPCRSRSSTT